MNHIFFLTGMPGAGKTFWAEKAAGASGYQHADLDQYIEQKEETSIGAIFARHGEDHFRRAEQAALHDLTAIASATDVVTIIACGGGTPCYFDNLDFMLEHGTVIYLRARIDTLVAHLNASGELRPLLDNDTWHEQLHHLLLSREDFYLQAHHIVDVETLSVATFDEIFRSCIKEH